MQKVTLENIKDLSISERDQNLLIALLEELSDSEIYIEDTKYTLKIDGNIIAENISIDPLILFCVNTGILRNCEYVYDYE